MSVLWMLNDLYLLVRCNTFYFKSTECLHAPCCLTWDVLLVSIWFHNRNVSASAGFHSRFSNTSCYLLPPSLFPSNVSRVSSWMSGSANWTVLLGLGNPFCLGWCSFADWYHDLHCCYPCYTQLLFALGTDTFLAIDLKALAMIRLKQKYTLLLVHIVPLFCNLNWSILNLY